VALTDTTNLYGAVPFVEAARRHGVRPLLGACLRQHRTHCVALVAEAAGWASLCRILTRLHLLGDVRLTELLKSNAAGLPPAGRETRAGSPRRHRYGVAEPHTT
jgi:DNA polymerase III alpha subunit